MLAQTLFLIAMLAIFAASAAAGIAGVARAQAAAAAKALLVPGIETALGQYQRYVATTIGAQIAAPGGDLTTAPAAVPALHAQTPWSAQHYLEAPAGPTPLRIAVDVVPTAQTAPSCGGDNAGPDAAAAVQCSAFVQESRLSLTLIGDAGPPDAGGTVSALAHSRYTATLRLFAQPPYAVVSGVDAAAEAGDHEGDTGGWGNALPAFAAPRADDTTIHVVYECSAGSGSCATSNPPPPDAPTTLPWTNGNGAP